jgi:cation diffusion facilitator family transporter
MAASSLKAVLYALGANTGIFVAKGAAAAYTGSSAMLAEAIHSAADAGNQVLLLLGIKESKRAPDLEHPLGYGKVTYFWAFLVAVLLFTLGGLFSVYEGWHKLAHPETMTNPWIAVGVLAVAIVLETFSLWGCVTEIRKVAGGRTLWQFFRSSRNSELIVVLGEDIAALAGLGLALGAVLLAMITANPMFDALGSIAVGVLLIVVAVLLSIEIKGLITGQSAEPHVEAEIRRFLDSQPEIDRIYSVITMQFGAQIMVAIKARMMESRDAQRLIASINTLEAEIRKRFPAVRWMFFEPDLED